MSFSNLVCTVHIQDSLSTPYSDAHHIRMQYKGWISSYLSFESTLFSHVDLLQSRKYVFIFKNWYDLFTNFYLWSEFGYDALMSQLNVIYPTILYTCIYSIAWTVVARKTTVTVKPHSNTVQRNVENFKLIFIRNSSYRWLADEREPSFTKPIAQILFRTICACMVWLWWR